MGICAIATCSPCQNWGAIVLKAGEVGQCLGLDKARKSCPSIVSRLLVWEELVVAIGAYWNCAWNGHTYILGEVVWLQMGAVWVLYGGWFPTRLKLGGRDGHFVVVWHVVKAVWVQYVVHYVAIMLSMPCWDPGILYHNLANDRM